jgi:hypothetical protein
MHIPPDSIIRAIHELLRVAKKKVVICEVHSEEYAAQMFHAFVHPYKAIVETTGATSLAECIPEGVEREHLDYKLYVFDKKA